MNIILTRLVIPRLQDPNITQEENAEDVTLNMKMENVRYLIKYVLSATRRDTTVKFVKNKTYNNSRLNNSNDESINNSTHNSTHDVNDWTFNINNQNKLDKLTRNMIINNHTISFQIDTGSTVNTLPMRYVTNTITKYNGTLTMWNNSNLKPKGQ